MGQEDKRKPQKLEIIVPGEIVAEFTRFIREKYPQIIFPLTVQTLKVINEQFIEQSVGLKTRNVGRNELDQILVNLDGPAKTRVLHKLSNNGYFDMNEGTIMSAEMVKKVLLLTEDQITNGLYGISLQSIVSVKEALIKLFPKE